MVIPNELEAEKDLNASFERLGIESQDDSEYFHLFSHLVHGEKKQGPVTEWTRVFKRDNRSNRRVGLYNLDADLLQEQFHRSALAQFSDAKGEILFSPLEFRSSNFPTLTDEAKLDETTLFELGKIATQAISRFQIKIDNFDQSLTEHKRENNMLDGSQNITLNRGYSRKSEGKRTASIKLDRLLNKEQNQNSQFKRCELSSKQLVMIINAVKTEKLSHREVAQKFRIKQSLIPNLLHQIKKDPEYLTKFKFKEEQRRLKLRAVIEQAQAVHDTKPGLIKAEQVMNRTQLVCGIKVSHSYTCQVLKQDLGFSFRKIKKVPFMGNSTRCLILRQKYAMFMLKVLSSNTRVINIDQTWINDSSFMRRKWKRRGEVNTIAEQPVRPRVSMIMAIDTNGKIYCSLTQVNTDSKIFCLFLSRLAELLHEEDPLWRQNTLIVFDGAKYQTSKESLAHIKSLCMNICISAPYSYASTPIEYAFAYFKSADLNPQKIKTGKRNTCDLVMTRLKQMSPQLVVKLWRHIVTYLFEYLIFKEL